jgi:hypothetical protein
LIRERFANSDALPVRLDGSGFIKVAQSVMAAPRAALAGRGDSLPS